MSDAPFSSDSLLLARPFSGDLPPPVKLTRSAVLSPLSEYIRVGKYSQHIEGRRENWEETINGRVMWMHEQQYGALLDPIRALVEHSRDLLLRRRVLGSARALQFGGSAILKKNARIFNCKTTHLDRPRAFQEMFWLLLCGCGVGFSVQRHHVGRIPSLRAPDGSALVYQIPDTIEGWADSLGVLVSSYLEDDHPFPTHAGRVIEFDASLVRPAGSALSSGSKAPGPEPLLRALELVRRRLDEVSRRDDHKLRPVDAYDIALYASDAVLAGGVRRSASLAMFSADDEEMITAKTRSGWWDLHPQRKRSNNSAVLLRDSTAYEDFARLMESTRTYGEPGFIWVDDLEVVYNPCVEAGMLPTLEVSDQIDLCDVLLPGSFSGVVHHVDRGTYELPGIQACNLCTINGADCETADDFHQACEAAATLGTLQAGYTDLPYLGMVSEQIIEREALLGVSITGIADRRELLLDPEVLERGAKIVLATNRVVSAAIGINPTARGCALKPEGTGSIVMGTLAQGIHPWPFRRGIKHVQANVLETAYQWFSHHNPHAVFKLLDTDPNRDNTVVIGFPFEAPEEASVWTDIDAVTVLEWVKTIRKHWIEPGTVVDLCTKPWLRHNVSNTISVGDDEWDEVGRWIYDNREFLAGVALLSRRGDRSYHLAPYTQVLTPDEMEEKNGAGVMAFVTFMLDGLPKSFGDLWNAVQLAVGGNGVPHPDPEEEWLHAFEAEATALAGRLSVQVREAREFLGTSIKDLQIWRKYHSLVTNNVDVPWDQFREVDDQVDFAHDAACAGGGCDVDWSAILEQQVGTAK